MKTFISTLALAATFGFAGVAFAEDAMAPAADAMAPMASDAMAPDAMATMTPDEMLTACLEKAGMEMDSMKKDDATKACHDTHNMAPMATDGMAAPMATDSMAAPMATDSMAADPGAMAPAK